MIRDLDWRWLWHVPASIGSLAGTLWGWFTHRERGGGTNIRDLRVEQTLKQNP
jgi:hypothetical protein